MVEKSASVASCCHYGRALVPFCFGKGHLGEAQELLGNLIAVKGLAPSSKGLIFREGGILPSILGALFLVFLSLQEPNKLF